jgi:hypothetical protein
MITDLVEASTESLRRSTVPSADPGTDTDDVGVDSAGDTVVGLDVELGESVLCLFIR